MGYQKSSREKGKKKTLFQMKWKKKTDASHHLMRVKAAQRSDCESTGIPTINTSSRLMMSTKQVKEEHKPEPIKVSDTVRTQSSCTLNDTVEFKVNLANFNVSQFNSVTHEQPLVQQLPKETKHGLSYESVLRAFSSSKEQTCPQQPATDRLFTSHKYFHYPSGVNLKEFMARAKPLLDYKKMTIK